MLDINSLLGKERMSDDDFERERILRQKSQAEKKKNIETQEAIRQALLQLSEDSVAGLLGTQAPENLAMKSLKKNPNSILGLQDTQENDILNALIGKQPSATVPGLQRSPSVGNMANLQGFSV